MKFCLGFECTKIIFNGNVHFFGVAACTSYDPGRAERLGVKIVCIGKAGKNIARKESVLFKKALSVVHVKELQEFGDIRKRELHVVLAAVIVAFPRIAVSSFEPCFQGSRSISAVAVRSAVRQSCVMPRDTVFKQRLYHFAAFAALQVLYFDCAAG